MPTCYLCVKFFEGIRALRLHYGLYHPNVTVFRCGDDNCTREFQSFKSFMAHVRSQHVITSVVSSHANCFHSDNCVPAKEPKIQIDEPLEPLTRIEQKDISSHALSRSFIQKAENEAAIYVAKLYSKASLARKVVQSVIVDTETFLGSGLTEALKIQVMNVLNEKRAATDEEIADIESMFTVLQHPFKNLHTEHQRFRYFEDLGLLIRPISYVVGISYVDAIRKGAVVLKPSLVTAQFIPLGMVFKKFFEMPGVYKIMASYLEKLSNPQEPISNFVQGYLWQLKMKDFEGKIVFPIFLFFDDYETCNPLGSHAGVHKLGAVYVSFASIPPEYKSALENIFLALLFHSNDRTEFRNMEMFHQLIEELSSLESQGIFINIDGIETRIYFVLGLILGDNLGLHSILGFVESFSANFPCRFCKVHKSIMQYQTEVDSLISRDKENYSDDVRTNDVSITGIKEECVWNSIGSFHVTENYSVDIMHDLYEGVCKYDVAYMLHYFIFELKLFSVQTLNDRIQMFDYGPIEKRNRPPLLTSERLKKKSISMSSAEMLCFVRYSGVIFGDLIPRGNEHWQLWCNLIEILGILSSPTVQPSTDVLLATLVTEHNGLFTKLFKEPLKPKFHFMLHYPYCMKMVGPLCDIASLRYESKHQEAKMSANATTSRKDISHTLAMKHQLNICYRLLAGDGLISRFDVGPGETMDSCDLDLFIYFRDALPANFMRSCFVTNWVNVRGTEYKPNMMLKLFQRYNLPVFGYIKYILVDPDMNVCFVTLVCQVICFDSHFQAYEVDTTNLLEQSEFCCILYDDLSNFMPHYKVFTSSGKHFVPVRFS